MAEIVKVWEEDILLPTYGIGKPEKNPMFLEKRVYQGSSGVVYPYPVIEKIEDTCEDKSYHAVYLENEYIKVMILPELGGRVQMAYDKVKQRHFIYYNHVIKPALVGLTRPLDLRRYRVQLAATPSSEHVSSSGLLDREKVGR